MLEFAGAKINAETGRITMTWPDGQRAHKEKGRKESGNRRLRDGLRQFLREFGDRPVDSFTRGEALTWIRPKGRHIQQSVRQFFNHVVEHEYAPTNHFSRTGASKRKRRARDRAQRAMDEYQERQAQKETRHLKVVGD